MVMWMILGLYALYRWRQTQKWHWAIFAGLFAGMAILTKVIIVYILGLFAIVIVLLDTNGKLISTRRVLRNPQVWTMVLLMVLPILIFYLFGREARAAQYFTSWTISLSHLLLEPTQYIRWFNMLVELMGLAALVLSVIGVTLADSNGGNSVRPLMIALLMGYILYGLTLPYQMATHSYYHLQLVPILAICFAPVVLPVQEHLSRQQWYWKALAICGLLAGLGFYLWTSYFTLSDENFRDAPAYWAEIGEQLPTDGKVVALTQDYGFPLAYYGWRKVTLWPIAGERQLDILRGKGKTFEEYFLKNTKDKSYFLITAFNQLDRQPDLKMHLEQNYPVLAQDENYVIYNLHTASP
jgi:4-amino-4-deoxy-L-arabinose transferase-like glycosyltransferase